MYTKTVDSFEGKISDISIVDAINVAVNINNCALFLKIKKNSFFLVGLVTRVPNHLRWQVPKM